jgi:MFS superfamily sulfate permease-like transporter
MNTTDINSPNTVKGRLKESLKYIKQDSLAGVVTGVMAVPLTVGICLMSEYPVVTGLYTVIFAGIVSFITYLFKPGNYTGVPGVAAGLAPALALGVNVFGHENMPFVILLTAIFQTIVWKFRWEGYILRIVPHYLVEGLLAGVGLKIALKFLPFLYDIDLDSNEWFHGDRGIVITLSVLSFLLFISLYKSYQKKMPALPYFVIMASSVILTLFLPLSKISIDAVPFELALPLPKIGGFNEPGTLYMLIKMIGFAIMLGTIDVIEQVMSNVAIEKMDPMKRKADSNNSLLSIWISNMGATFFGGMTNLDGLAKSTTNTVAGAKTKLSNLIVSLFLLLVVLFPEMLTYIPKYALGIIMVYSGWKMIANLSHVQTEGRYALIMAAICGLLVFKLGIFEGLLILLAVHGVIQYIFMRRVGKSNREIAQYLKQVFGKDDNKEIEMADMMDEPDVPILNKWVKAVNEHDVDSVMRLYSDEAMMLPAFSTKIRTNKDQIKHLFRDLLEKDRVEVMICQVSKQKINGFTVDTGHMKMKWSDQGFQQEHVLRFSMVISKEFIATHHSSIEPEDILSIAHPHAFDEDYVI